MLVSDRAFLSPKHGLRSWVVIWRDCVLMAVMKCL